jgi:hypothetical protein
MIEPPSPGPSAARRAPAPHPPPGRPGPPAWLWFALPCLVGGWAYLVLSSLDDGGGLDRTGCPTGGLSTSVGDQSVSLLMPPVPGAPPDPHPAYEIELDIEVVNRGTAPIDLVTVDVGVAGDPDNRIVGRPVREPIRPHETITVAAHGVAPGTPPAFPVADPQDIDVVARWSNPDHDVELEICGGPA